MKAIIGTNSKALINTTFTINDNIYTHFWATKVCISSHPALEFFSEDMTSSICKQDILTMTISYLQVYSFSLAKHRKNSEPSNIMMPLHNLCMP